MIQIYRGDNTSESYNKTYKTVCILLGIGLAIYLCVDIYTQGLIFINLHHLWDYLYSNNNTDSNWDSSSSDSDRTITPSNTQPQLEQEEIISIFTPRIIPEDSRYLELGRNRFLFVTPDNRIFITDRSTSPLGSITNIRFELDRNNNLSRTEILTTYPENRLQQQLPEAGNINFPIIPEEIYNRFRFNIPDRDNSLNDIFDILS